MQSHQPLSNSATELFPYQSSPNTAGWNLWYTFHTHLTQSPAHALIEPLGRWFHPSHALIRKWQSYIDPSTNIVYLCKQDTFEVYETLPTTPNYKYTRITVSSPPSHSVPVDLNLSGSQITRSIIIPTRLTLVVPPPTTFETYLQSLDQWEYQLLCNSTTKTDAFHLSETFQTNPKIIAASDGSISSSIGAYRWTCSLPHGQHLATNHRPVFGHFPSSFHAEAYGFLSYLRFLYQVSQYTQSPLPKQNIIYTDSASLIEKLGEIRKWPYFFPNTTMDPDWDILQQIIFSLRLFPSLPEICSIQGHQDDDRPYTTISLPTQLNVDADHLDGSYIPHPNKNPTIVTMIAGSAVSLHLLSRTITTKYRCALCKAASTDPIQHYIQTKNKWSNNKFTSINWIAHGHSVCSFYHKKQFIDKFIHEW